jgi:hypothetical protein
LTTNSDARKNLSWQTFRIGRGVKKTDVIDAKKRIMRSMAFGFLRGRVRCTTQPLSLMRIKRYFNVKNCPADTAEMLHLTDTHHQGI